MPHNDIMKGRVTESDPDTLALKIMASKPGQPSTESGIVTVLMEEE